MSSLRSFMTRIEVFHSLWTSSAPALNYVDLLTIVAPPVSFRIVRRLTHRAPPSSRAQEIRYFLHRVVRASIYHDTYARLSSPLSPFERRQKNHEPPSCCSVYTNFQRTTKASLAGVLTVSSRHVPSSQISFDVLVFRSLLAAD